MNAKLQEQQDWINSHRPGPEVGEHGLVKDKIDEQTGEAEGDSNNECHLIMDSLGDEARKNLAELDSFKVKLNELSQMKSKLVLENSKMRQSIEQARSWIHDFKPEPRTMDIKNLEEEHKALLSDKAGETEYSESLQYQIEKLKGISHMVKCACGKEYKVEVDLCA